ncbi:MAG: flagellar biosynthetic protein FliO [Gammaproteobacteria bacterium]
MKPSRLQWMALVGLLMSGGALAADPATGSAIAAESLSGASNLMRLIGALVLILGLIFLMGWLARRFGLPGQAKSQGMLKTLDSIHLNPRERILLISVENHRVLVGVSPSGMTRLGEYTAPEGAAELDQANSDELAIEPATASKAADSFAKALNRITARVSSAKSNGHGFPGDKLGAES